MRQDRHLWAESYDRDLNELTSLQSESGENSPGRFGLTTAAVIRTDTTSTPTPRRLTTRAAYWFISESKESGIFRKAINLQPDYAAAWSGIADYYTAAPVEGRSLGSERRPRRTGGLGRRSSG